MHWPATQFSPAPQQLQPHSAPLVQLSATQLPLLQTWPQAQAGEQALPTQTPFVHLAPPVQPQVPPQPSPPPQVPSVLQTGLQQLPP